LVIKRLKKDFYNYFIALKDYKRNLDKYRGLPKLPSPKKLSKMNQYSIPLDSYTSISLRKLEKQHLIGINLSSKMRYFYIGKDTEVFKNVKLANVKYQNNEIYLQFSYELNNTLKDDLKPQKYAGLDIGLKNLVSLFIDDRETSSLLIDGANYKYFNYRYNKLISKLDEAIAKEAIEFKTTKTGTRYAVKWNGLGMYLKKFKTYLTQKRNEYFKSNFHKLSRKIVEYLQLHGVTDLVISSKLAELKNNGKCNLSKQVKQSFIQIPFIKLLQYIEEKCCEVGIKVIKVDESYTSEVSCISSDVLKMQAYSNGVIERSREESTYNGKRIKRGLFKDTLLNKVFNADLNGAVNHIKLATDKSFTWLKDNLWKLNNPIKLKSAGELHNLLCNIRSNKSLKERTTACACRYSISY
ncbi:MAG: IS200/IS605 family accessory protein TnpB-related protein, partial [Caldisericaceae bacterium]